jgi:hypothetical protein
MATPSMEIRLLEKITLEIFAQYDVGNIQCQDACRSTVKPAHHRRHTPAIF